MAQMKEDMELKFTAIWLSKNTILPPKGVLASFNCIAQIIWISGETDIYHLLSIQSLR